MKILKKKKLYKQQKIKLLVDLKKRLHLITQLKIFLKIYKKNINKKNYVVVLFHNVHVLKMIFKKNILRIL